MYNLTVDDEITGTYNTLDEAYQARNKKVREILDNLYARNVVDKYAFSDWLFGIEKDTRMEFYLNEGAGYNIVIKEVGAESEPAPTPVKKKVKKVRRHICCVCRHLFPETEMVRNVEDNRVLYYCEDCAKTEL